MIRMKHPLHAVAIVAALSLLALPAGAQPDASASSQSILVDGSSTVEPVTSAVSSEYTRVKPGIRLSVAVSGTSGGFRRFTVGETDISDASRAIKTSEIETAAANGVKYTELLVAFDGLTVAVDRETKIFGQGAPCMTVGELQLLWSRESEGVVKNWKQLGSRFASAPITLSGAASTSGTFDFFTEAINGDEGDTRSDYFATEEDQLLAEQTGQNPHGLTYFGYAFYLNNQNLVQPVAIDSSGSTIDAPQAVLDQVNAKRRANGKEPLANQGGSCRGVLPDVDTIGAFAYKPLTRPLFIYVNGRSAKRPAVDGYVDFYLSEPLLGNREFMLDVGYVPITRRLREAARSCWEKRIPGSAFGGEFGGLTAQEISQKYSAHCQL